MHAIMNIGSRGAYKSLKVYKGFKVGFTSLVLSSMNVLSPIMVRVYGPRLNISTIFKVIEYNYINADIYKISS